MLSWYSISKFATTRSRIKEEGAVKLWLPDSSPYVAYYVFTKEASRLYGAGTKWCTTSKSKKEDVEFFENLIYFIHKTDKFGDDPIHYKIAMRIESLPTLSPTIYLYDALNSPMPMYTFMQTVQISNREITDLLHQLQDFKTKRAHGLNPTWKSENPKSYHYLGQCDRLRTLPGGEEGWQEMMKNHLKVSEEEFLSHCDPREELLDEEETLEDFIAADPTSYFAKSTFMGKPCYFIGTHGFEFLFVQ